MIRSVHSISPAVIGAILVLLAIFYQAVYRGVRDRETVFAIQMSPDRSLLARASARDLALFDLRDGRLKRVLGGMASRIAFSRDSKLLASSPWGGVVQVWETETGKLLREIPAPTARVSDLAFSPEGALAFASEEGTVRVYKSVLEPETAALAFGGRIDSMDWSPDGRTIAAGGDDGGKRSTKIVLWDGKTFEERRVIRRPEYCYVRGTTFSPDSRSVASVLSTGNRNFGLWNVETGESALKPLEGAALYSAGFGVPIAFSPDGNRLVSVGYTEAEVWDLKTGLHLCTLKGHEEEICGASFSEDGASVLTADRDGELRHWNAETGSAIRLEKGYTTESSRIPWVVLGLLAAAILLWILIPSRVPGRQDGPGIITLTSIWAAANGGILLACVRNSPRGADPISTLGLLGFLTGLLALCCLIRAGVCRATGRKLHFPLMGSLISIAVTLFDGALWCEAVASV